MVARRSRPLLLLLLLTLVGCTALPFQLGNRTPINATNSVTELSPTPTTAPVAEETTTPSAPQETAVNNQPEGGNLVRIWLPPEFDPDGNNPASQLLANHLEVFVSRNPGVRLEVRVKAGDGEGGLLDALVAANAAAPLALPDLVLLSQPLLESAALKGLLYPMDELTALMDDPGWFEYARQLARLKSSTYGIPFAGDALVLAYQPSQIPTSPPNLEGLLPLGRVLLFPATDPQALFTLSLYLAEGKSLQDTQGRPALDEGTLMRILLFDQLASAAGMMPYWLAQYSNDVQIWEAFTGEGFPMAVTWTSAFLLHKSSASSDLALASLPTLNGTPFSLATGWSWALAGQDPERRLISVRLAEFMVEKDFLAQWSLAASYLPPRIEALQSWQDAELSPVIEQISASARLMPPADLISSLGPALEQAVVDVLKNQSDPQSAAQTVIKQVNPP